MPLFDLSDRVKLRLRGRDRVRFLNGQVTNDVRKAGADHSLPACVLSAKGKIDAFILIGAESDALLLDADPALRTTLAPRLERYVIADDVTIEDVTRELALFHVTGELRPVLPNEMSWRSNKRYGTGGWDLFVEAAERDRTLGMLSALEPICDAESAERWRIEQGIPRWAHELTDQIIPLEANLESEAIDYSKGCYIGQEVISRMRMSGQTNKRLRGLLAVPDLPLVAGMRLASRSEEGQEAGWITSATRSDRLGKQIALGFVKRGFNEVGTRLIARCADEATTVEVVELPFR
ncbi:MAG: YgfZ/GcvT domain-containing protein [Chthoniobacterales bacterium]